ncbi:D-ribose pyranase [Mycoplasmopsis cricetuli]|uniref:D-ribose pyranase n=1 Tax=Mycoplasmopsis cricetuli TaxID=171283 RepID=UPI0004712E07|nr:D-ribose pyranase [Mycoplasmopsis cricetuli]
MFQNKNMILNPELVSLIAKLGHFDEIVICDAGLPFPNENQSKIIDLSLVLGIPNFMQVFNVITQNLAFESIVLASEIKTYNQDVYHQITSKFSNIKYISHSDFKKQTVKAKAFIRTGETTPYANAIIICGVNF